MSAQFNAQLDKLLEREKVARVNNEHFNSVAILKDIITLCYKAQNWEKLFEMINFLMNRRGQGKKAQIQMIQLAMTWIHDTPQPHRTRLIETIRDVTAKKIFLQVQYARCILMIVKGKQNDNDILEAAKILQQVQVQTYGSMDRREKLQFILYQMKIMIKKEDFVRLYIISKKINEANLGDDQIADIKITYYSYMAIYHNNMNNFLQASKCYRTIWKTLKTTKKMLPQKLDFDFSIDIHNVLSNYVGFLVLHPYSVETEAELQSLKNDEQLQKNQAIYQLISNFLSQEIVPTNINQYHLDQFELFRQSYKNYEKHREQLKRMLTQHNIRIISKYYTQLTLRRMSDLINVEKDYCEQELCHLNNDKVINCRIDRIDDTIDFKPVQHQNNLLQSWNQSINQILDMVDITSNLINREKEIYGK